MCLVVPFVSPMLVTIHLLPLRSNVSPGLKTMAVSQYSVFPLGKSIVNVRGTALPFRPPGAVAGIGQGGGTSYFSTHRVASSGSLRPMLF
jgi:hypothetical protein